MSPAADVQIEPAHAGRLARARRLPGVRAFGARVPLVARIALASALLAVLVAAAFTILVLTLSDLRVTTSQANRSKDVTSATLVLEQDVLQLDAALRGYVNTGDRRFLRAFRDARTELPASTAALDRSAAGREGQESRARSLVTAVDQYMDDYAELLIGIAELNAAVARSPVAVTEGRRRIDGDSAAGDPGADQRRTISRRRASRRPRARRTGRSSSASPRWASPFSSSSSSASSWHAPSPIRCGASRRRPSRSRAAISRCGYPEQGPAEVHDLAASFNEMAASLERSKHELEDQNRQLRESERLRSELISVISHEVRTPLACVLGYTSLLQTRPVDEATRQEYLSIIADEARRLEGLVGDLVDVKRIEQGRLELEPEPFDLGALLEEQVRIFKGRSERHTIQLDPGSGPLVVRADRSRLAQVIANLLANAVKYSPGRRRRRGRGGGPERQRCASASATTGSASRRPTGRGSSRSSSAGARAWEGSAAWASGWRCRARSSRRTAAAWASRARSAAARSSGSS